MSGSPVKVSLEKAQDDTKNAKLSVGQELHVELPESTGTGFMWDKKDVPDHLEFVKDEKVEGSDSGGKMGGAKTKRFVFKGKKSGSGKLVLEHGRSFETEGTKHHLNIDVTVE